MTNAAFFSVGLVVLMTALVAGTGGPGGKTPLSEEELQKQKFVGYVGEGLTKFHELKASSNGPACVEYTTNLLSGTIQVVAGFSYDLTVVFTPAKKTTEDCTDSSVDLTSIPVETCVVNIWEKVANQGTEIKIKSCA